MSHNLGANTLLDPDIPVKELNGDDYQWGNNAPASDVDNVIGGTWGNQGGSTATTNWLPNSKGTNDPCPVGFRVPSQAEWKAVDDYNTASRTGTFSGTTPQFGNALHYGPNASTNRLTLPAAGFRLGSNGEIRNRDGALYLGYYWSSTWNPSNPTASFNLSFDGSPPQSTNAQSILTNGLSVRCIAE
jgi:uncharacterized protein (TIGR02145 family)